MGVVFESEDGRACELQLDFEKQRVQMNDALADRLAESLPALYEMADQFEGKQCGHLWNLENIPQKSINFCLPDIPGMDTPFTLRILCRSSRKLDSTVIDAEIAGRRTIVSGRPQFFPNKLRVRWDGEGAILSAAMEELADPVQ